jgi:hypothetical protein
LTTLIAVPFSIFPSVSMAGIPVAPSQKKAPQMRGFLDMVVLRTVVSG